MIRKRAGRRPALRNQHRHEITREASEWYTDSGSDVIRKRAGRRPALRNQHRHEITRGASETYTDRGNDVIKSRPQAGSMK